MRKDSTTEVPFFFGGIKQAILFLLSAFLLAGLPIILVLWRGIGALVFWVSVSSICLGFLALVYYSGYYHRWLSITLVSLAYSRTHNIGLEARVQHFLDLLRVARSEVLILSGSMRSDFYELDSIVKAVSDALARGITIKILVGKDFDNKTRQIPLLLQKYADNKSALRMYRYPSPALSPEPHFIVVDKSHVRIEEPHLKDAALKDISALPIQWHNAPQARHYAQSFYEYWDASSTPPL